MSCNRKAVHCFGFDKVKSYLMVHCWPGGWFFLFFKKRGNISRLQQHWTTIDSIQGQYRSTNEISLKQEWIPHWRKMIQQWACPCCLMKSWEEKGDCKNESTKLNINIELCYLNTSTINDLEFQIPEVNYCRQILSVFNDWFCHYIEDSTTF